MNADKMDRLRRGWVSLFLLSALVSLGAGGRIAGRTAFPLEVSNLPGCPVQILEQKSRVTATLNRDPWAAVGTPRAEPRAFGSGEYQLAFDVAFRNGGEKDVVAVIFLWEALDDEGHRIYRRIGTYTRATLGPAETRSHHELALDPARGAGHYRLSIFKVQLANGTTWAAPAVD
jgi:hypothetical protein